MNAEGKMVPEDRDEELEQFVIKALKNHRNIQSVLIPQICAKTGWDWDQCTEYVEGIRAEHAFELTSSNFTVYMVIGAVIGVVGLGLILLAFDLYIGMGNFSYCFSIGIKEPWPKIIRSPVFQQCLGVDSYSIENFIQLAFWGLLMVIGSITGIIMALKQLRD